MRFALTIIAGYINENLGKVLCLAAGDTPLGVYRELIRKQKTVEIDLTTMYYAALDEWIGLGKDDKGSCRQVMDDNFYIQAGIVGLKFLLAAAGNALIIANGEKKASIIACALSQKDNVSIPLSHFHGENVRCFFDKAAASIINI